MMEVIPGMFAYPTTTQAEGEAENPPFQSSASVAGVVFEGCKNQLMAESV